MITSIMRTMIMMTENSSYNNTSNIININGNNKDYDNHNDNTIIFIIVEQSNKKRHKQPMYNQNVQTKRYSEYNNLSSFTDKYNRQLRLSVTNINEFYGHCQG